MRFSKHTEAETFNRKELVRTLAAHLGIQSVYNGMPTRSYTVGPYTIDGDGSIVGDDITPLRDFLIENGYAEPEDFQAPAETGNADMNRALFPEKEKGIFYVRFNMDGLMRGDYKSRMEGYAIGRQNGWLNANDIRALENMNPIPDEQGGNVYLVNGNMIPIHVAAQAKTASENTLPLPEEKEEEDSDNGDRAAESDNASGDITDDRSADHAVGTAYDGLFYREAAEQARTDACSEHNSKGDGKEIIPDAGDQPERLY